MRYMSAFGVIIFVLATSWLLGRAEQPTIAFSSAQHQEVFAGIAQYPDPPARPKPPEPTNPDPPTVPDTPSVPNTPRQTGSTSGTQSSSTPTARLVVWVEATPNIWVARGEVLTYTVHVKNTGNAVASSVTVSLSYSTPYLVHLNPLVMEQAQISAATEGRVLLLVRNIQAGEQRDLVLSAQVATDVPEQTVLSFSAEFPQKGANAFAPSHPLPLDVAGRPAMTYQRSNIVPVLVGNQNVTSPLIWMDVTPNSGTVGTIYRFFSDRFLPDEEISMWLDGQGGVHPLAADLRADGMGHITYLLATTGYAPGTYQLIMQGRTSHLQAAATFVVR